MAVPIFQIDAFTDRPFCGNPAAVVFPDRRQPISAEWMQQVAMEMNLAETAFVTARPHDGSFDLRWFTPAVEVDLCGHATLASAHALWESTRLKHTEPARFHTKSGLLTCVRQDQWIEMDFPATPAEPVQAPPVLLSSLRSPCIAVARSRFDFLVEMNSEQEVRDLAPDLSELSQVPARGIIVTARASTPPFDFVSRFFAPQSGIDEDPVTGSAHCCLGPWWQKRLQKDQMLAYQASKRGGSVRVTVKDDRILLGGQAVTTLRGELTC